VTSILTLDGMAIPVAVGGGSRLARLTIERDGSLQLRAGENVGPTELQAFVESKREWIYSKLAEKEILYAEPVTKELVNGEGFLYLGRSHQLRIVDRHASAVQLDHGRLVLPKQLVADGCAQIINWYRTRGTKWLRARLDDWTSRLRVEPRGVEAADLGYKWGSATPDARVRIHWAAMQLRSDLIDYVLAHELAHLHEPHHGATFWALLSRVLPDYEDRRARLAHIGAGLWFGRIAADPFERWPRGSVTQ
jgi:predicted metal-dependent hydrolase